MRGRLTKHSEIIDSPHQPLTKDVMPDSIDIHPSGQGIVRIDHGTSHGISSRTFVGNGQIGEGGQIGSAGSFAMPAGIPTNVNWAVPAAAFDHRQTHGRNLNGL